MATDASHPYDVVLTYVDGSKPKFREQYRQVVGAEPIPCQTRSLGELPYVLRSIEKFAPWLKYVYLVVSAEDQVPTWIDRQRVRVVTHEQFMPASILPTFNPHAIFAHLYAIEGLAERFLMWSDDVFFMPQRGAPELYDADGNIAPEAFIYSPVLTTFPAKGFNRRLQNNKQCISRTVRDDRSLWLRNQLSHVISGHAPMAVTKNAWTEFLLKFKTNPAVCETIESKTRDECGVESNRTALKELWFAWMVLAHPQFGVFRIWKALLLNALRRRLPFTGLLGQPGSGHYGIRHCPNRTRQELSRLMHQSPCFFCLNDEAYDAFIVDAQKYDGSNAEVYPESLAAVHEFLQGLYPNASSFERGNATPCSVKSVTNEI